MTIRSFILLALATMLAPAPAPAATRQEVFFRGEGVQIHALMLAPDGAGPFPAVVALHGCSGLMDSREELTRRHKDWADRLVAAGFIVLLPDSYESRGLGPQCRNSQRTISPARERAADARASLRFLAALPNVKPSAISLLGWSNGGSTVLYSVMPQNGPQGRVDYARAISFYPGCRLPLQNEAWAARIPLLIMIGEADDWTPARACSELAARARAQGNTVDLKIYPGAYHDFDDPDLPVHVVDRLAYTASGGSSAHTGTDPAARADSIKRVLGFLAR